MIDYVDVWNYYDGMLSGLLVRSSKLYYFELQGDDLYPLDRCYDLWYLRRVPTRRQAEDVTWKPKGDPVDHIYESDLRALPQQSHPELA